MQKTIQKTTSIEGVGLHSGKTIHMTLKPAAEDHGIVFIRTDVEADKGVVPAKWDHVVDTQLCSVIANNHDVRIGTIEHLMAALCGLGIDNLRIEIDGPEVPIMDGSSMPFVEAIEKAGLEYQAKPRRAIRVLKEVCVMHDGKKVTLSPSEESHFTGDIDFEHPSIGRQSFETTLVNGNFKHDIANARTFGFMKEVEWMRSNGLALGGSMDNAIVLGDGEVLNPEGLRSEDEFIRHKLLDAIGDLYLAGGVLLASYDGHKAGHAINNAILKALFADPAAYEFVDFYGDEKPAQLSSAGGNNCEASGQAAS